MFTIDNREVHAPGFSRDAFLRAVELARDEDLYLGYVQKERTVPVHNRTSGMTYLTTRTSCTCTAGQHGYRCKHMAWAIYHFDVLGMDLTRPGHPARTDRGWVARRDAA